jgi:hypothetical protein
MSLGIIGDNRPRLYQAMLAAHALGGTLCRYIRTQSQQK